MFGRAETVFAGVVAGGFLCVATALQFAGVARNATTADGLGESTPTAGGYTPRIGPTFVNWETPHVHPIELTPDGSRLLVVNTAAGTLEVFTLAGGGVGGNGASPAWVGSVPVGIDPATVRARGSNEAWVVNTLSDTVSVVNLITMNVVKSLKTKDEPRDVVFAGTPQRAFVSCSAGVVQVFNPSDLSAAATDIAIAATDPRSMAVSPDGQTVYCAMFTSGNHSTILGGGATTAGGAVLGFPPNVVSDPLSPYGNGVNPAPNPPPNSGAAFSPAIVPGALNPPAVGLIVKKNAAGQWMDDNNHNWTHLVSGPNAGLSGRPVGWDILDNDLAVINASSLGVAYATGLMNIGMSIGINPATGSITVVGTEATNEVRFEPVVKAKFTRVELATVNPANLGNKTIVDLNPHLDYSPNAPTAIAQTERNKSIGDPRAIVWNSAGTKAYVTGMGSNNVTVINPAGARAGLAQNINVGEGPTGIALDEARGQFYVLNRFAASISVINTSNEVESHRISFFDPSPTAIKVGRKHLYDTHKNSGLGQIACASCHVDGKMDRLAWDLGDPTGAVAPLAPNNLGANIPGLNTGFAPFHPMKGPMTTQTLQDIIGHEPHHWRGDRTGIEAFAGAFIGLQGDDTTLTTTEMQQFEDFLATIYFPPNPFRNFDNTLPTNLPLPGHYTTGRFGPAGQPLPNGNAVSGLAVYRDVNRRVDRNALACVTCHTLPTGAGTDTTLSGLTLIPIAAGPMGERHRALVSVDGSTNISIKVPQLRNMYEKIGFNATIATNTAGFGYLHDGSVDSIERFVSEPVFALVSDQEVSNMIAFMLAFSGSDLPQGSTNVGNLEPPGGASHDTPASVGWQTTLVSLASPEVGQLTLITNMLNLANQNKVGVIVKGRFNGVQRGWTYTSANTFQSDHAGTTISLAALQALAAPGSELTFTVVVNGTQVRLGTDADLDGILDFDEPQRCIADFDDGSGNGVRDGGIGIEDLLFYLEIFDEGGVAADVDDGSSNGIRDGGVGIEDLLYYLTRYDSGC